MKKMKHRDEIRYKWKRENEGGKNSLGLDTLNIKNEAITHEDDDGVVKSEWLL